MISTADLSNNLQLINDEITNLMDEWYEMDQHFDSERLERVRALEAARKNILDEFLML